MHAQRCKFASAQAFKRARASARRAKADLNEEPELVPNKVTAFLVGHRSPQLESRIDLASFLGFFGKVQGALKVDGKASTVPPTAHPDLH